MREKPQGASEARPRRQGTLTLAFANQKGGVGKTTLIINLAIASLRQGRVTTVLDIDPQKSAERFAELRADATGEETPVVVHGTADGLKGMLEAARDGGVGLVLIDCPGTLDRTMLIAATLADLVIVPTRSSVLDQHALADTLEYLEMAGKTAKSLVVLNAALDGADGGISGTRAVAERHGVPVAETRIENARAFSTALGKGRAVVEASARSKPARSVEALLHEIATHCEKRAAGAGGRRR